MALEFKKWKFKSWSPYCVNVSTYVRIGDPGWKLPRHPVSLKHFNNAHKQADGSHQHWGWKAAGQRSQSRSSPPSPQPSQALRFAARLFLWTSSFRLAFPPSSSLGGASRVWICCGVADENRRQNADLWLLTRLKWGWKDRDHRDRDLGSRSRARPPGTNEQ